MKIVQHDALNFLLTNRLPRRLVSRACGWWSRVEHPWATALSMRLWRAFTALDLHDAQEARFASLHACFTRRLRAGARPVDRDPAALVSPCDAIVGAHGTVQAGTVLQVKGMPYAVADLLRDPAQAAELEGAPYVTLRLTSAMYHRFHAPCDGRVVGVTHIFGDRWNVNPPALRRVGRLFCRNERAWLRLSCEPGARPLVLVAVAAILVGGIRLSFLDLPPLGRKGRRRYDTDLNIVRGDELGWFEHGSTIVMFGPLGFMLAAGLAEGVQVRAGQALLRCRRAATY